MLDSKRQTESSDSYLPVFRLASSLGRLGSNPRRQVQKDDSRRGFVPVLAARPASPRLQFPALLHKVSSRKGCRMTLVGHEQLEQTVPRVL
jgi:hypothetical protein